VEYTLISLLHMYIK